VNLSEVMYCLPSNNSRGHLAINSNFSLSNLLWKTILDIFVLEEHLKCPDIFDHPDNLRSSTTFSCSVSSVREVSVKCEE
jgi:hypothetical protein